MTSIKPAQVAGFVRKPDPACRAVLVYGPDRGGVSEHTQTLVKTIAGTLDDPFAIARFDDAALQEDPGHLEDEARAIPMMGGKRVVWISNGGAYAAAAVERYLKEPSLDAVVIVEAANLQKSAKLRQVFEKAKVAAALACYADTSRSLDDVIDDQMGAAGLSVTPPARQRLIDILGADRRLSRSELEKLALYCHGSETIELEDVDAVCGDASALELDDLVDATFEGDLTGLDRTFYRLISGGLAPQAFVSSLFNHISKLQKLQLEGESGGNIDSAMARLRPPVHFSRKQNFKRQAALWSFQDLERAANATAQAELETRRSDDLVVALLGRHFLSLGRAAHAKQRRR